MAKIDVGTLNLTPRHYSNVMKALKSGRLSYGPMTEEFETKFSTIHGNKFGIFTNSGTSALQAAIHALKILNNWQDGDEIIMPATTFVATYNVILQNNLRPVLVDVGWDLNIDPVLIEDEITARTVAILPVHLLGKPANMDWILKIAKKHNLKVIEDSCETMFVKGIGKGDVTCTSFYIAHLLTTGVGGMAITNNRKLAELIRSLIFHGRDNKYLKITDDDVFSEDVIEARFRFNYPGYSYRATEVEAALGLAELKDYSKMIAKRQSNANYLYKQLLDVFDENDHFATKEYQDNHAFMMAPLMMTRRNELVLFLEKKGITTRTIMPLINQPYIKVNQNKYPVSKYVLEYGLLVGCHQGLEKKDLKYIADSIKEFYDFT